MSDPSTPRRSRFRRISKIICYIVILILFFLLLICVIALKASFASIRREVACFEDIEAYEASERNFMFWREFFAKSSNKTNANTTEQNDDNNQTAPSLIKELLVRKPISYTERTMKPLIEDLTQLSSAHWTEQLTLNPDLTAQFPEQGFWIYLGGTAPPDDSDFLSTIGRRVNRMLLDFAFQSFSSHNCADPPYICDAYNRAYDLLVEKYHTHRAEMPYGGESLSFVDCDVSSLTFDHFRLEAVVLMHIQTHKPCRFEMEPKFEFICSTTFHFVPLPLKKLPFSRRLHVSELPDAGAGQRSLRKKTASEGTGPIVEVFPDAFEQLHLMVSNSGSVDGIDFEEGDILRVEPPEEIKEDL